MLSHFITIATVASNISLREIKFKALCLNQPEVELAIQDTNGKMQSLRAYTHTLSVEKIAVTREGKITLLGAELDSDGNQYWAHYATVKIPPTLNSVIIILSGEATRPKVSIISDSAEKIQAGSLRFINICPYAVGVNISGFKKILLSGTEAFCTPDTSPECYGQGEFFTANQNSGWRPAGGIRWLQLSNSRTLWLITPDPQNQNHVIAHGIEDRLPEPSLAPELKTNPVNAVKQTNP